MAESGVHDRPVLQGAGERIGRLWDGYFAGVLLLTLAVVVLSGTTATRTGQAVAAIVGIALLHLTAGRRIIRAGTTGWRPVAYLAALLVVFGVALGGVTSSGFLLFLLCPLTFLLLPRYPAIALCVVANAMPAVVVIWHDGVSAHVRTHYLPMAVGGTLLSAGLGLWIHAVVRQSRERAELIEQLEASRAEVARLSREAGVGAERTRLAGEIHDTLAQGFTSIITLLQAARGDVDGNPHEVRRRLDLAVRTARDNLAESRAMIGTLAPAALGVGTLDRAIGGIVSRLREETGIEARHAVEGAARQLPTTVEVVLVRAAQELLSNVRRHAGATQVAVVLSYVDRAVRFVVTDDGRGFDPGAVPRGFGLAGVQRRADQVNGTLAIHSGSGGTRIELEVPT
ncbi:sensor histidine kinase [Plantactinospora sp. GCM10030261]|uniref:sensor histidine kinase n=1 Tax=Plantactinospora sp. GCM10030261 TaxID=3273420 RepID=UPI00361EBC58